MVTNENAYKYALGMTQLDGVKPSDDAILLAQKVKNNELTSNEAIEILIKKRTIELT